MKRYNIDHNELIENQDGCLVSYTDFNMAHLRAKGDMDILASQHDAKVREMEGEIKILKWKLEAATS